MTTKDTCAYCGNDLSLFKTIYAVTGELYCCKDCAVSSKREGIVANAHDEATAWFDECAEEVNPRDIGIDMVSFKVRYWSAYNKHDDLTTVFKTTLDDWKLVSDVRVVGWYNGEPNIDTTKLLLKDCGVDV